MSIPAPQPPAAWAAATFGAVALGDHRLTQRLVTTASAIASNPQASLPEQMADPAALHAAYRLLGNDAVRFEAILAPHAAQTRQAATGGTVLLVQDTTTLDYSAHPATTGLGPISALPGHGLHLQTQLAIQPAPRLPLGVLGAAVWARTPAPDGETRAQRTKRARESDVWGRLVTAAGPPPPDTTWVHVADRGADCYGFFSACQRTGSAVLARIVQDRCITDADDLPARLVTTLRAQPAGAHRPLALPRRPNRPAREATVAVAWTAVTLQPPTNARRDQPKPAPIPAWAIRVWEPDPPSDIAEPVEWLLLTTVPIATADDAWERVDWYTCRWLIEDVHQCLKTGCQVEQTQLRDAGPIQRRLAMLLPLAVRLLTLREVPRVWPEAPAALVLDHLAVQLLAARTRLPVAATVGEALRQVARLGGHQGRRRDGPPGWRTLWRGWWRLETLLEGARLAATLPDP